MSSGSEVNLTPLFPIVTLMGGLLDAFVPLYAVVVLYIIWTHHRSSKGENGQKDVYVLKKTADNNLVKKDWKTMMTGRWNQAEADDFDGWLIFNRKSYAARLIAPTIFFKFHSNISFTDKFFEIESDFGGSGLGNKIPHLKMEIGTCAEDAKYIQANDRDKVLCEFKCWYKEDEDALYCYFCPVDKTVGPYLKSYHIRKVIDNDLFEMKYVSEWSDTGEKAEMTTLFRRVS